MKAAMNANNEKALVTRLPFSYVICTFEVTAKACELLCNKFNF